MAITDGLIVRVQPVAGDTAIKNLVDNSTFTGTGTPTLVDEGAEKAWQIAAGTSLQCAINAVMSNVNDGGKTIVMRIKVTNFGTLSDQKFLGLKELSATAVSAAGGPHFYRDSSTSRIRGRTGTLMVTANTLTWLNTIVTIVYTPTITAGDSNDVGKAWWNRTDRVGTAADTTSTAGTWIAKTFASCFISASDSAQYNLLDFLVYDRQLTEAESSELTTGANGLRAQIPAPSGGGTAPTGTVTLGTPTGITSSSAAIPYTYSASDQTGFEYRLNGGAATTATTSPLVVTGLTASTPYTVEMRAINASGNGAWSAPANFMTSAATAPVSFTGTIPAITGTQNTAITPVNASTYFSGGLTPFTYSLFSGTLPTGVTLNTSTGIISGTPTVSFSGNIVVRATDTGSNVANSNSIAVNIAAASTDGTITLSNLKNNTATPLTSVSGFYVTILSSTNPKSVVYNTASVSSNASAAITFTNASIVQGTEYRYFIEKDGVAFAAGKVTAT